MPFLIGTDEAGYGPNLGPLTITGTLWESAHPDTDLYELLSPLVSAHASKKASRPTIQIADSKRVYSSSGSIQKLETSVLSLLYSLTGKIPENWRQLVNSVCPQDSQDHLADQTWLLNQDLALPLKSGIPSIKYLGNDFRESSHSAGVKLIEMSCVPIFPPQFNFLIDQLENKATLLSIETLKIVRRLKDQTDDDLEIGCDKHGGRSRYGDLIAEHVTCAPVGIGDETLEMSDYCFREHHRDVTMRFQSKGESFLPTALASMVSKYVREVFMLLWNEYWCSRIPNLKPTKGYPVDARRFKSDIETLQTEMGIADDAIWRKR